jgi:protein-S-isoprenylcysteine O-methyltransferase Ste14
LIWLAGLLVAGAVAYIAAKNPEAKLRGTVGPLVRGVDVPALITVGIYAWARHPEEWLGRVLVAVGFVCGVDPARAHSRICSPLPS